MKPIDLAKHAMKKFRDSTAQAIRNFRNALRGESPEIESDNPLEWHRQRARELGEPTYTGD